MAAAVASAASSRLLLREGSLSIARTQNTLLHAQSTVQPISCPRRAGKWARQPNWTPATTIPASRKCFSMQRRLLEKKYTQDHEWIDLAEDGKIGTIGITNYASKSLGDVVYVELPTRDLQVAKGDTIGAVESVKSASDIMTPISGTIVEANEALEEKPALINKGPEGEGWLARIRFGKDEKNEGGGNRGGVKEEMDGLMNKKEYDEFVQEEGEGKGEGKGDEG